MRSREKMQQPQRISIVGATGSGKSFFARKAADRLDLPVHELDTIRRDCELSGKKFRRSVEAVSAGTRWIIDGHYREVRELIWDRADVIVWLNYPALLIAYRLARRFVGKRAQPKSAGTSVEQKPTDAAAPAAESASWSRRLARIGRTVRERREYRQWLGEAAQRGTMVIELGNPAAAETWLGALASATGPDAGAG